MLGCWQYLRMRSFARLTLPLVVYMSLALVFFSLWYLILLKLHK